MVRMPCGAGAFHFPSSARTRSEITNEGKVDTAPSHISSSGADMSVYDWNPKRLDKLKAWSSLNGSKTCVAGVGALISAIALVNVVIATVRDVALVSMSAMSPLWRNLISDLLSRLLGELMMLVY